MKALPGLEVRQTPNNGLGLFTTQSFAEGSALAPLGGPLVEAGPKFQVGASDFMGPSGTATDAINHSCNPSAWVDTGSGFMVKALRPLAQGEEVTLDYSVTHTTDTDVFFRCKCGAINCRGLISSFGTIPVWQQEKYIARNIVPGYVKDKYLRPLLGL